MSYIRITIVGTKGSTPRNVGTKAYVSHHGLHGTIGGGQLEYIAITHAREMLEAGVSDNIKHIPLSPHIGQCCGGAVTLEFTHTTHIEEEAYDKPHVCLFGLGSTGKAIKNALSLLPLTLVCGDEREGYGGLNHEDIIRDAPQKACYIITTHSHALDFALAEKILSLKQPKYVGMIGSTTKAARFHIYYKQKNKNMDYINNFYSPMGVSQMGVSVSDKRPEIIASLVAAQIAGFAFGENLP